MATLLNRVVVGIYVDPDFYPPTINAILNLAEKAEEVVVVTRNNSHADFPYPSNVRLIKGGPFISVRDSEKKNLLYKITAFLWFTWTLFRVSASSKTDWIVLYDAFPLLAWGIVRRILSSRKKCWYHNHDMPSLERQRKGSIGWFAARYEHSFMKHIQLFSLPSADRLAYYPNRPAELPVHVIPNYPSLHVYHRPDGQKLANEWRIIFQGFIGAGHGLEELLPILKEPLHGKKMRLILKGSVRDEYRQSLIDQAESLGVSDQVTWVGIGPYADIPKLTASCHVGIAIHKNTDIVSKTLGTASNKIYEYAASGLPVILYDIEQFTKYLGNYPWAFFCDGSESGLKNTLAQILPLVDRVGLDARKSFEEKMNFEQAFQPALADAVTITRRHS
jgi:glycosyltransferase involved in cell wall biosynthesis